MFFSVAFPDLSVVAHSQWDDRNTWCKLRIITTREAAEKLLDELPVEEAESLRRHLLVLKQDSIETSSIEIDGNVALSLSNFIAAYHNSVAEYKHISGVPELLGFWEPPENRKFGDGIIMWFDQNDGYHVAIVRSREQAEYTIQELRFLEEGHRKRLIEKIRRWNATPRTSREPLRIDGPQAELLCRASIARKSLSAWHNAWNPRMN